MPGSVALPVPPVSPVAGAPGAPLAPVGNPAPVSWDQSTLQPLVDQLIPALEKADVESLCKKAKKISPDLVQLVKEDGNWNAPAKTSLQTTLPSVAAKWLNAAGISAENAGEVICGIAILSICTSRMLLMGKLTEIAEKQKTQAPPANAPV